MAENKGNIMKLLYFTVFLLIALCLSIPPVRAALSAADCFAYYDFQNGIVFDNLKTEKASYTAGEQAIISYNLVSRMDAPIVDGAVKIQIYYQTPTQELLVKEFFSQREVYLFNGDSIFNEYKWDIPADYKPGTYVIKTYFVVADRFNLGGINFLQTVPGQITTFQLTNPSTVNWIYFDKDSTSINDQPYMFTTFSPEYVPGTAITIKTILANGGSVSHNIKVKMELYKWDDLLESSRVDSLTKETNLVLAAGQKSDLTFNLNNLSSDSYLAVLTATDESGNVLSILKLRFSVTGEKGRFIYLGLDKFPLLSGQETTLFVCFSGAADYISTFPARIVAQVVDENGKIIYSDEMSNETIVSSPTGRITMFSSQNNYFNLTLRGIFYDAKGNVMDSVSVPYDYSKFVNIPRTLTILANARYPLGDTIKYTINYNDNYGNGLPGKAIVSLIDQNNKLASSNIITFNGSYKGSMAVPSNSAEGLYKISVIEIQNDVKAEKEIQVVKSSPATVLVIGGIVLFVVIAGIVFYLMKRK
jgi:hypothetical protein